MENIKRIISRIIHNRYTYAQYIAIPATITNILGILLGYGSENKILQDISALLLLIGMISTFVAYCLGGLWTAIKTPWKIAIWGWFLIPIFPVDLVIFVMTGFFGIIALLTLPIIPIRMAHNERMKKQAMSISKR